MPNHREKNRRDQEVRRPGDRWCGDMKHRTWEEVEAYLSWSAIAWAWTGNCLRPLDAIRPVFVEPDHNLIVLFCSERLASPYPSKKPAVSSAMLAHGGFTQFSHFAKLLGEGE